MYRRAAARGLRLSVDRLRTHDIRIVDGDLVLRPMTEDDWPLVEAWNADPEVLYFVEGDDVAPRLPDEVRAIYRHVSRTALMFIIEVGGRGVGECWLQDLNLPRLLERLPGQDVRRIDLMIGDRSQWNRGYGTRAIRLLTRLGFEQGADAIFGCDIADYNPRSRAAFENAGYSVYEVRADPGPKGRRRSYDVIAWRA